MASPLSGLTSAVLRERVEARRREIQKRRFYKQYYDHHFPRGVMDRAFPCLPFSAQFFGSDAEDAAFWKSGVASRGVATILDLHGCPMSVHARLVHGISAGIAFDFDLTEKTRFCACGKNKTVCPECWVIIRMVIHHTLHVTECLLGLRGVVPVFSGGRGVHFWVFDPDALSYAERDIEYALMLLESPPRADILDDAVLALSDFGRVVPPGFLTPAFDRGPLRSIRQTTDKGSNLRLPFSAHSSGFIAVPLREQERGAPLLLSVQDVVCGFDEAVAQKMGEAVRWFDAKVESARQK